MRSRAEPLIRLEQRDPYVANAIARRMPAPRWKRSPALTTAGVWMQQRRSAPDALVPRHSHPHEQLGVVLRGELNLMVAGHEHLLREMGAYTLPGELEHQAQAGPEGALVLDVFQPVREEHREAAGAD